MNKTKLCVGTAKIGDVLYGYPKRTDAEIDIGKFITDFTDLGINRIDTSPRYGDCEKILGKTLKNKTSDIVFSTKIDNLKSNDVRTKKTIFDSIENSLNNLNLETIDICYLHQNDIEIISDKSVMREMQQLKDQNLVGEIGTSIYTKEELAFTLNSGIYDWVQIPANILDISLLTQIIKSNSTIKVAARSLFLQGILFDKAAISRVIRQSDELLEMISKIEFLCEKHATPYHNMLFGYVSSLERISEVVVGTLSIDHLESYIHVLANELSMELIDDLEELSAHEKSWTNPRNWQ